MKTITLIIDGKEIEAQVNEEDLKEVEREREFGRAEKGKVYFYFSQYFKPKVDSDEFIECDKVLFDSGNYFLTEKECEDTARVVSLWLRMKRFADEHNKRKFDFDNVKTRKFFISYNLEKEKLTFFPSMGIKSAFQIYFYSAETAHKAIDEFHDELMWYFTEYGKDN